MFRNYGQNAKLSRLHNRALALRLVIQSGGASRKQLADRMGLTKAAMTKIGEELIALGLVNETPGAGGMPGLGRRPIPLAVNPGKFRILTLQLGRRRLRSYLTDAGAGILQRRESPSRPVLACPRGAGWGLLEHTEGLIREWDIDKDRFFAIAIAAPGPVRAGGGHPSLRRKRYSQPYMWDDLHGFLSSRLGCPVFAENDSNLMAIGEQWFGRGKGCSNFVLYDIGEGIGAAAVIDDMLYRGHNNVVAEVGHITVMLNGETCSCGNRGCLELYASFDRLRRDYLARRDGHKPRSYADDLLELFGEFDRGVPDVSGLVDAHAEVVAQGAVSLANMFSPEKIVVAAYDGDWIRLEPYVARMRDSVKARAFSAIEDAITIEASELGSDIMAYGGTALVMSELPAELDRPPRRRSGILNP